MLKTLFARLCQQYTLVKDAPLSVRGGGVEVCCTIINWSKFLYNWVESFKLFVLFTHQLGKQFLYSSCWWRFFPQNTSMPTSPCTLNIKWCAPYYCFALSLQNSYHGERRPAGARWYHCYTTWWLYNDMWCCVDKWDVYCQWKHVNR